MLTHEAIDVHLAALHKGQDELREDVRELRADNRSLRDKIGTVNESLAREIKAVNATLGDKISTLGDDLGDMRGMQKAMLWVVGGLGSLGFIGKIFRWF